MNIAPNLRSTADYQAMDAAHHWHPFTDTTDLATTERLALALTKLCDRATASAVILVAESGIRDRADIERLEGAGAHAFLVGESLMREHDLGLALRKLRTGKSK